MKPLALMSLVACACCGCQVERFSSQPLGNVPYVEAFNAARNVFAQYFSIESADAEAGKIVGRPRSVESPRPERLLGVSPERQLAVMRVRRGADGVLAEVSVRTQRQDVGAFRGMEPVTVDNESPARTPAQESGPLSADQDQAWQPAGRDYALERAILNDLLNALAKPGP